MSIFGTQNRAPAPTGFFAGVSPVGQQAKEDRPAAQYWLNIGYRVEVPTADGQGTEVKFVSLPVGIPLDTMKPLEMPRSQSFAQLQAARNDLLEQVMKEAQKLEPGEDVVVGTGTGLEIQIRRVSGAAETPAVDGSNPFARDLGFART
jgi:hypothetical protein